MAKSVFSLDLKTTVVPEVGDDNDSFDAESIESDESLLQSEAIQREQEASRSSNKVINDEDEASPITGKIFLRIMTQ